MPYQNITLYAKWDLSSVIEYDNVSLAKTYCYEDTITYCESNNLKVTTYSALNTMKAKVYLNPNNYKDGFVKLEYNWDVIPHDRWDDYMSISHNPNIYLLDDTIKGTLNYEYIKKEYMCDSTRRCWITSSNLIKPNPTNYDLTNNQDNFKFDQSYGVIFSASLPGDVTYTYNFEEVTKINFTLESRFRIQSDGTQSFRVLGIIKFGFDYRHSFLKINLFNIGSNANVTLSGADLGMSINPTLLIDVDESRYSSITLEFN